MEPDAAPPALPTVHRVPSRAAEQAGYKILVGSCPCGREIAVNGEGKLYCTCGRLLHFHEAE